MNPKLLLEKIATVCFHFHFVEVEVERTRFTIRSGMIPTLSFDGCANVYTRERIRTLGPREDLDPYIFVMAPGGFDDILDTWSKAHYLSAIFRQSEIEKQSFKIFGNFFSVDERMDQTENLPDLFTASRFE